MADEVLVQSALRRARLFADEAGLPQIDLPQLVSGLAAERAGIRAAMAQRGVSPDELRPPTAVGTARDHYRRSGAFVATSPAGISVSVAAASVLRRLVEPAVHTDAEVVEVLSDALTQAGLLSSSTATAANAADQETPPAAALQAKRVGMRAAERARTNMRQAGVPSEELSRCGVDLTQLAQEGVLDPVVGRTLELRQLQRILSRRRKSNPLLVGPPGVGKTALVEALALELAAGTASERLTGSRLVTVDMAALLGGTRYRGEFESRVRALLDEAMAADERVVLFIDEVHLVVGAGAAEGGIDAASLLMPALARGDLSIIGATTPKEYRAHFGADTALARRFQSLWMKEPTPIEAVAILAALKSRYETFHNVRIGHAALPAIVEESLRTSPGRHLPDAAIELMDDVCIMVAQEETGSPSCGDARVVGETQVRQAAAERLMFEPPRESEVAAPRWRSPRSLIGRRRGETAR